MSWLKKKTGDPCKVVSTKEEVDAEVASAHFAVVGAFKVRSSYLFVKISPVFDTGRTVNCEV